MRPKLQFSIGDKYGRLTIVKEIPPNKSNQRMVLCRCDCGEESERNLRQLLTGVVPRFCTCLVKKTKAQLDHEYWFRKKGKRPLAVIENLPNEVWKDVIGFEGLYHVSSLGRVKAVCKKIANRRYSTERIKILPERLIRPSGRRYKTVCLFIDGTRFYKLVHRLVAAAFIPNPANKPEVNHKDGNKTYNSVSNLEWVTKSENELHCIHVLGKLVPKGENHSSTKLTFKQVCEIRRKYIPREYSTRKLASEYNVSNSRIVHIVNNKARMYG